MLILSALLLLAAIHAAGNAEKTTTEMENKTILEWLEQAKENGVEWAEKAISEAKKQYGNTTINRERSSIADALHGAFIWEDTLDGHEYWSDLYFSLK